jgi:MFS family permease
MPLVARQTVISLGFSQLICWGVTYYLIGVFGDLMVADLGWRPSLVHGGFSAALLVMGLASPVAGWWIDRSGGRPVMVAGSGLSAFGCIGLALAHDPVLYFAAWLCLGLAMRFTLYDAAFAALARIGGPSARRPIAEITLLGGLASTAFWPLGHVLAEHLGWRGALVVYAGLALSTIPLHLMIPSRRYEDIETPHPPARQLLVQTARDRRFAAALYATSVTLTTFLNSGMSAHMIAILSGLGIAASVAVGVATLRGIGQSAARLGEILFGARLHPLSLHLTAAAVLPICFGAGLLAGHFLAAALAFAFLYGAGNGIATIARGTMPLVLFDYRTYGTFVGRLLVPSFLISAAAPLAYAFVIERLGHAAALALSIAVSAIIFAAALTLRIRFGGSGANS